MKGRYPTPIPSTADRRMIRIGCTFFMERMSMSRKIPTEHKKAGEPRAAAEKPFSKKTVCPVDITAAAIRPTTAGFRPDMQP